MPVQTQHIVGALIVIVILFIMAYYLFPADKVLQFSGCENDPRVLSCPAGTVIKDGSIKYGRWDNGTCPHPTVGSSTASKFQTYPLPPKYIGGQTATISDTMNLTVGSDPYPNVYKQIEIDYTCGAV